MFTALARLRAELSAEAVPHVLIAAVPAALVIAVLAIVSGIGIAVLIFTGPLQPFLFYGIGGVLFGSGVMLATLSLTGSYPGCIGLSQEVPAVILGLLGTTLFAALTPSMNDEDALSIVILVIALSTVITGTAFLILGTLRLGDLIRFIPYPLIGGVLASLGWLLIEGGVTALVNFPLTLSTLDQLFMGDNLLKLVGGLLAATALLLARSRFDHFALIPAVLGTAIVVFYIALWLFDLSPVAARDQGWLLGPFPAQGGWSPPAFDDLARLDWALLWQALPIIGALVLTSTITILLYASALELEVRRDIDLNHELRGAGLANLLAGMGGGATGFHSISGSQLARAMGAPFRLTGLLAAALVAAVLFGGFAVLAWLPRPVLGGLLMFLGASLLLTWVVRGYRTLPRGDWMVILLILVTTAWFGFLAGISAGMAAGILLFTRNYSQVPVVKHELNAATLRSNVDRPGQELSLLEERGRAVYVLTLQGFIFFGTANKVLNKVLPRIKDSNAPPLRFLVLDFSRVSGLDISSVITLRKLEQLAGIHGFVLVFSDLKAVDREMLQASALPLNDNPNIRLESDLDHALEHCEQVLLDVGEQASGLADPASELADLIEGGRLGVYAESCSFEAGERLIRQGDPSDDIYIIHQGRVSVRFEDVEENPKRLRSYGPGTLVGEMAFYMDERRSASVFADTATQTIRLSRAAITRMTNEEPELAAALHQTIAALLAARLAHNNELLRQLS